MSPEQFKHYLVGNPKYDAEHYMIFEKINIFRALDNPSKEQCDDALSDVLSSYVLHCAEEESFMEEKEFPYRAYHIQTHHKLQTQLQRYISMHSEFGKIVKNELYDFSVALAHHIDEDDRQFYDLHKI